MCATRANESSEDAAERLQTEAQGLLTSMVEDHDKAGGLGSMTCTIYDTSWLACVKKQVQGVSVWLFEDSFKGIIDSQLPSGAWPVCPWTEASDDFGAILSTLAGLHAVACHLEQGPPTDGQTDDTLIASISKGQRYLDKTLAAWDVQQCTTVGFEILVPALLDILANYGIQFEFEGRFELFRLRKQKLTRLNPRDLYHSAPSTILHSLEAFFPDRDFVFDNVRHQKVHGSLMASPAATAAYLMRCSEWDQDAENYLRLVVEHGDGRGSGFVPSAYPSTHFELLWTATTMLSAGLRPSHLGDSVCEKLLSIISDSEGPASCLTGFAPGLQVDLDDSAKLSSLRSWLGKAGASVQLQSTFAGASHFKTYSGERNPSFSANCNALGALLHESSPAPETAAGARKIVAFLCQQWRANDGNIRDKWNVSPFYSYMVLAEALCLCLSTSGANKAQLSILDSHQVEDMGDVLSQCTARILKMQNADGSWGVRGPKEETAYAMLALCKLGAAGWDAEGITRALGRGRAYMLRAEHTEAECVWIEKVCFGSKSLSKAYFIAALYASLMFEGLGLA